MTLRTTKLRQAIITAIAVGVVATPVAFAQEDSGAGNKQPTELDRISVTGSRIRKVDAETAQPIVNITRDTIEKQGAQSVGDILQQVAATGSPALSRSAPLNSGESPGGTYIDLRNLGATRTLVLLNGRRLGPNNDGLQDLSTIPSAMVERIEVLKDGASSLYGSDAIAGVINVITRNNFDGAEAGAYLGQYGEGDGGQETAYALFGATGERTAITFGAQYDKEDPVWARDRWWAIETHPGFPDASYTSVGAIGNIQIPGRPGWWVLRDGGDPTNLADYREQIPGPGGDTSVAAQQMMAKTGIKRQSIFTTARFDLTDAVRFNVEANYNRRETDVQIAGYPYQSASIDVQTPISANSYFNPTGVDTQFRRRGWEVPRATQRKLDTYRFTGAFEGSFDVGERFFDWDVGYSYNRGDSTIDAIGDFNKLAVAQAVGPSFMNADGVIQCGTPDNPIALSQCTPWSPVLSSGAHSLADPRIQDAFYMRATSRSESRSDEYFANISGAVATLPGGDLGIAAGLAHRRISGEYIPDALSQSGYSTNLKRSPTRGSYSVDEAYVEVDIPLLKDIAGAKELAVNLASRYSDYNTFGDTTNSKFSFRWKPIDDLLVRGTWAQGFRAPAIADLYGGQTQTFDRYNDPCDTVAGAAASNPEVAARCAADIANYAGYRQIGQGDRVLYGGQTAVPFTAGSNPDLTPETAISRSLGLVYSPGYVEGLGISLDFWRTRIDNVITAFSASGILEDCYVHGIQSQCDMFTRDPVTGTVDSLLRTDRNAGYWDIEGYDFEVNYALPENSLGRFALNWQSTYFSKFETKADDTPNTVPQPEVGFAQGSGENYRIRSVARLDWDKGDIGASWTARYFSGIREDCIYDERCNDAGYVNKQGIALPKHRIGAVTYHDVQFRVSTPWNAKVALGVNNVFDKRMPLLFTQPVSGFSNPSQFDIGRFAYLKYTQSF